MARITYNASINTFQELWDGIDDAELTVKRDKGDKVVLADDAGDRLTFSGKNLDWTDTGFADGSIREISLSNAKGKELFELKNFNLEATSVQAAFDEGGLNAVLSLALTGNDEIKGSKGADWLLGMAGEDKLDGDKGSDHLLGGAGNDLLIGGQGSDYFVFEIGGGTDFVKDFGSGKKEGDFIAVDADLVEQVTWAQSENGKNLIVSIGGEDSLILKNVDAEDFTSADIVALPPEFI